MAQFKFEIRQKEREIAQLLESLQRHEMVKDDLRISDRELKQFRTKSQLSETRNKELTTQVCYKFATMQMLFELILNIPFVCLVDKDEQIKQVSGSLIKI